MLAESRRDRRVDSAYKTTRQSESTRSLVPSRHLRALIMFVGCVNQGVWGVVLVVCVCVGVGGVVLCRCVCVCDLLIFLLVSFIDGLYTAASRRRGALCWQGREGGIAVDSA